ncbi:response regulator transcription factor [Nocardia tengchongensis]|uniref:Response regulator transcription factor n=1 Tax=Nocardia tengchongensis TaxID=2055889 RepID=A0ABX8CY05_9NOCA|nr:response regulator transcription factor [Nocardia tengchongensis]QVI24359.1 response regulator transcription factor [Nocardia tengchongensis]
MTIRVLIVDDQQLVRAGLRMLCHTAADLEVIGEASGGSDAVRLAADLTPDVILMDLRMPGMDGIRATERILAARPTARVLALTTFDDDDHLYPALEAGACGFLVKDAAPADLLDGIRRAATGERPFSPDVLHRLALLTEGLSNAEIAARLVLGVTTVKTHVTNLMAKTGSPNRVRLAIYGLRHGAR